MGGADAYLVSFDVWEVHGFGNVGCDSALSASCWSSDQPDMWMFRSRLRIGRDVAIGNSS
jgi:hypothetical protein